MKLIAPGDARNRHRGIFYVSTNRITGQVVLKKWPVKRPRLSPVTLAQNADLRFAMSIVKYAAGEDRVAAGNLVAGKPFLAQDALVSAAYGNLVQQINTPQGTFMGYRVSNAQINLLLDSISSVEGSILIRGVDDWAALLPGTAQQVLTVDPTTLQPDWADAQGGGGGGGTHHSIPKTAGSGYDGGAHATDGMLINLFEGITIDRLWAKGQFNFTDTCNMEIWSVAVTSSLTLIASIAAGTPRSIANPGKSVQVFDLPAPVSLLAGTTYFVCFNRQTGGDTQQCGVALDNSGNWGYDNMPLDVIPTGGISYDFSYAANVAKNVLAPGVVLTAEQGINYGIGIRWTQ